MYLYLYFAVTREKQKEDHPDTAHDRVTLNQTSTTVWCLGACLLRRWQKEEEEEEEEERAVKGGCILHTYITHLY